MDTKKVKNKSVGSIDTALCNLDSLILEYREEEKSLSAIIEKSETDNSEYCKQLDKLHDRLKKLKQIRDDVKKHQGSPDLNMKVLLGLQENDRVRIARDLHDTTVQELVHIIQKTELCMRYLNNDNNQVNLELASIIQSLRNSIEGTRNIIYDLRPMSFDDIGFAEAIQRLADDMMMVTNFSIETDIDNFENYLEYQEQFISLYRVVTELVRNAIYHSGGSKIFISIKRKGKYILVHVKDNGKGFNPDNERIRESFGLQIVKSRLKLMRGTINFISDSSGTDVEIKIKKWENTDDRSNVS